MSQAVASAESPEEPKTTEAKGHPKGLYYLFATEMAERFSYYGMRALLVLYLIQSMGMQPQSSSTVYKWYTSLVYLTPLLGGYLADRFLGLRMSIVVGGVLMAIGQFLLVGDSQFVFYAALALLIAGNGFFKPNISTLVGRMYTANDPRRDGAFTIFYMGINIGAFLSPWICGEWLRKHYGFHYGFAAAGFGMLIGLGFFLAGQKQIKGDVEAVGNSMGLARHDDSGKSAGPNAKADLDDKDEKESGATGAAGAVAKIWPLFMLLLAVGVPILSILQLVKGESSVAGVFMKCAFAAIAGWMGLTLLRIKGRSKDKSVVIFVLFVFAVIFWMAFEQAGNALNIWAEYNTERHLFGWSYSAEVFQSVNPALIFALAPLFSMLWVWMARKNWHLPTPSKMAVAMVLMITSFAAMVAGAASENSTVTTVPLAAVPSGVDLSKLDAGRMKFDAGKHELEARGVVPEFVVSEAFTAVVDPAFKDQLAKLEEPAKKASADKPFSAKLEHVPASFALRAGKEGEKSIKGFDPATSTLTLTGALDPAAKRELLAAASPPAWRDAIEQLSTKSEAARVSGFWLFLSYLLATLGELCLSPVGLSMVTKLAPARYASLFMGVWMLASSVAQYVGGSLGELWGTVAPTEYFTIFVWTSVAGAALLIVLAKPLKRLMHGID